MVMVRCQTSVCFVVPNFQPSIRTNCEIVTFLIQGGGGGLGAARDDNMRNIGSKVRLCKWYEYANLTTAVLQIFLVGLILQLISFLIFIYVFVVFCYRLHKHRRHEWDSRPQGLMGHWLAVIISMAISCVFIVVRANSTQIPTYELDLDYLSQVRSVYRTIENGETQKGPLATQEAYFYLLDCLPIWFAIV